MVRVDFLTACDLEDGREVNWRRLPVAVTDASGSISFGQVLDRTVDIRRLDDAEYERLLSRRTSDAW
jgi:hypothetical protein